MDIPLSRQPVFDASENVAGYRIAHATLRDGADSPAGHAAHRLLVNAFLNVGVRRLAGGQPAFIATNAGLLRGGCLELLDPAAVYLELSGRDAHAPDALRTVARLRAGGYRFTGAAALLLDAGGALVDVVDLLDVVRFDAAALHDERFVALARGARSRAVTLLADNVPDRTERDRLAGLGFALFHGYGFTRPDVVTSRELGVQHLRMLELLRRIRSVDVLDAEIAGALRADVSLSYKLLRMVNSAAFGVAGMQSIDHALRLLGRETLYRWLLLLFLSSGPSSGAGPELVASALMRARLCERLAAASGRPDAQDALYTVGLLSRMDSLLGVEMATAIEHMGLSAVISAALLERAGHAGTVLRAVEAYDVGAWQEFEAACAAVGIPAADVPAGYLEAIDWAARHVPPARVTVAPTPRRSLRREQAPQPQL